MCITTYQPDTESNPNPNPNRNHTIYWRRGSVVRASVFDWRAVNQPGQLSLLPSVGRGISSISVATWVKLLAAVSPSSECLYEGKADVVYLQVTLCDPRLSA